MKVQWFQPTQIDDVKQCLKAQNGLREGFTYVGEITGVFQNGFGVEMFVVAMSDDTFFKVPVKACYRLRG